MIEKPNLTEQDIVANYNEFLEFIKTSFQGERQEKLLDMYAEEEMGQELATAPASMSEHFHFAFPGGYLLHVMRVAKCAFGVKKLFQVMGCRIDFTDEEMIFAALHHDLGKLGDDTGPYYVPQSNDWKLKQGEQYEMNPNVQYMEVTDRAAYVLQLYGVKFTWKEYLGMKLADGMYKEAAKAYLVGFRPHLYLKTNLPRVIHVADYIACRGEYDSIQLTDRE